MHHYMHINEEKQDLNKLSSMKVGDKEKINIVENFKLLFLHPPKYIELFGD